MKSCEESVRRAHDWIAGEWRHAADDPTSLTKDEIAAELNASIRMKPMEKLTIVSDIDFSQCLYVDGKRWSPSDETDVWGADVVAAAAGKPVTIEFVEITFACGEWPTKLERALVEEGSLF